MVLGYYSKIPYSIYLRGTMVVVFKIWEVCFLRLRVQFGVGVSGLGFRVLFDCKKPEQHNTTRNKRNYVVAGSR